MSLYEMSLYEIHPALTTGLVGLVLNIILSFIIPLIIPANSAFFGTTNAVFKERQKNLILSSITTFYIVWFSALVAKYF